jgi:hypothetical protein
MTHAKLLLSVSLLLTSPCLLAQQSNHSSEPALLARLAYDSSGMVARTDGGRDICLAVFQDGSYRALLRVNRDGSPRLKGKMSEEQLKQLKTLIDSDDFRKASGPHGGLIRRESQNFRAEVVLDDGKIQRLQWLTTDGDPFPGAVEKVVTWLNDFQLSSGATFDPVEFPDVCPSVGLSRVQPTIAQNHP